MKLKNFTKIDTHLLKEIIRLVRPAQVTNFDIAFKNTDDGWHGRAYTKGTSYHDWKRTPYVVINVPRGVNLSTRRKPFYTRKELCKKRQTCRGYMPGECYTDLEELVAITAHELRHLWQCKIKKGYRVWGARGQYSERDADAYAIRMTRAWRRK